MLVEMAKKEFQEISCGYYRTEDKLQNMDTPSLTVFTLLAVVLTVGAALACFGI